MNICLFFGTFNPIHNAHLRMAEHVLSTFGVGKVVFVPAFIPPHKRFEDSPQERLEMVRIAVCSNEKFEVSDIEFRLAKTSYTYLTILELKKLYPDVEKFNFLIGTDAFEKIETWFEAHKLKNFLKFIVFRRENDCNLSRFEYLRAKGFDFVFTTLDFCDISSTEIRERIIKGEDLGGLVPKKIEDYINAKGLYR